jgi:hypothetical protein
MAAPSLDRELLDRLTRSTPWREYLQHALIPHYLQVTHALDSAREDHRYLQGMKEGLRMAIEQPYVVCEQPSPLTLDTTLTRQRQRPVAKTPPAQTGPVVPLRQSYLA